MVVSRQDVGRTNQKHRTRRAIVDAAAELVREHKTPTVADAAARALVSRATAYRYFPSQQSLLVELHAENLQGSPEEVLAGIADVGDRVEAVVRALTRMILRDEAVFRSQLRAMQETWFEQRGAATVPVREGRRLAWITVALEPVSATLPADTYKRLTHALCLVCGVEPVLSLKDVCGLAPRAIEDTLVWSARALVEGANAKSGPISVG